MAVYNKIDANKPVNYARATVQPTPNNTGPCQVLSDVPVADTMPTLDAVLNAKFKTGGTTTWERPGQA